MNRFFRTLTGVLSASIIISSVTFLPVLAQAPDVSQSTEQMTTTENEDSDSSSSVNDETQDVAVIFTETAGEDGMTSGSLAGTTDTIQDMNSLATALGVDNVSVLSETQVMLVKDIVIPTGQDKSFLFAEGSYTIDFNGHIIRGQ